MIKWLISRYTAAIGPFYQNYIYGLFFRVYHTDQNALQEKNGENEGQTLGWLMDKPMVCPGRSQYLNRWSPLIQLATLCFMIVLIG